ncbi:protein-lysine N-methyltransferase EEF2KMT-like [Convolutriloba macropyga]|uniref:protein-lysine N-methyltransferase EEF2KMT-like n=1 Tax=Convolutriloba macropyga TaxID=536237 RepID=UPI003F525E07
MDSLINQLERGAKISRHVEISANCIEQVNAWLLEPGALWRKYKPRFFLENLMLLAKKAECHSNCNSEALFEVIGSFLSERCMEPYFCIYRPSKQCPCCVVVQENNREVRCGTTGLFSWPAADAFVKSIDTLDLCSYFCDKTILEVGCGVGLLGISFLILCQPEKYLFTDISTDVLEIADKNIKLNFSDSSLSCELHERRAKYEIFELNFCRPGVSYPEADVLVGSDLVYDPTMVTGLVMFICAFLKPTQVRSVYIACSVRSAKTFDTFISELKLNNVNLIIKNLENTNEELIKLVIISSRCFF